MKSTSLVVLSVFEDQELRDPTISGGGVGWCVVLKIIYFTFRDQNLGSRARSAQV